MKWIFEGNNIFIAWPSDSRVATHRVKWDFDSKNIISLFEHCFSYLFSFIDWFMLSYNLWHAQNILRSFRFVFFRSRCVVMYRFICNHKEYMCVVAVRYQKFLNDFMMVMSGWAGIILFFYSLGYGGFNWKTQKRLRWKMGRINV